MKVICAGAAKTGTKSMARALRLLGYNSVFDIEEAIEFAFKEWEDIWEGRTPDMGPMLDSVYADVDAVVDLPHSYFFDKFLERWPKSKVILMTRDEDAWFTSYKNMVEKAQKNYCILLIFYYLSPCIKRMADWYLKLSEITVGSGKPEPFLWKTWLRRHNAYVRVTVPRDQLLEFDVKEGWEPLCTFLNLEIPDEEFPCENKAGQSHDVTDRMMQDTWIAKQMAAEVKLIVATVALSIAVIIALAFYFK
uniref:Uncharacterized LOC100186200 n=1 Tax=Ciona intestinalis TaxID=7719 RepID=A0A1W5BAW6_CIOIN|nr:uncharacterized protein LOC100186200 [Ciona intestinalis]|eukprot:XP_026690220.1 uncharacterized protein LOC100186200 [Ciona intestinalis]